MYVGELEILEISKS